MEADKEVQKDTFTRKMFFRLWWPGTLAAFPYAIGEAVDAIVLGNHMGTLGLAAISFCVPIFMLYNIITFSFGLGGANRFSILMGEGSIEAAKKCFNDVLKLGVITGFAIAVLGNIFIDSIISALGGSFGQCRALSFGKKLFDIFAIGSTIIFSPLYYRGIPNK